MTGVVGGRPELVIMGSNDYDPSTNKDGTWKEFEIFYKPTSVHEIPQIVMPHQPRFAWQLWFSALSSFESEYYLIHFLYKLLNNDPVALSLLSKNPFDGDNKLKFLKIELDHYQFTDYRKERVTFGLKNFLTKSRLANFLPLEYKRYFTNEKVTERIVPHQFWRRSTSESEEPYQDDILMNQRTVLTRQAYFPVVDKESLETFIKQNKLSYYNQPNATKIHPLSQIPMVGISVILIIVTFFWNFVTNKKIKVIG